jgi:23S rRNA pseudoU1915 N3-methylase RlmH
MKIYPVPASSYVIIEYKYATNFSDKAQIEFIIHNANGKSIETIYTNKNQDQLFLNTLSYPSGLYVCTMKIKGKNIESDKFTIAY